MTRRWDFAVVTALALLAAVVLYWSGIWVIPLTMYSVHEAKGRQVVLLYKTDHQDLLRACRELSARCKAGDLKPGQYNVLWNPAPEAKSFPKAILAIPPSHVIIDKDGWVMVAIIGGMAHCGVVVYPEGNQKGLGDKELVPGLWYYDDGYHEVPDYEKHIQSLKPH